MKIGKLLKITGISALGMASMAGSGPLSSPHEKPNILIILVDDLGFGDLSIQGTEDIRTPNIDSFIREGIRLTNFYANSTVCSPTRASLLTGCYPDKVGVPGVIRPYKSGSYGFLSPDAVLLPELLRKNGYQTSLVGKWHLGPYSPNLPNERGFDEFKGFIGGMLSDYWKHTRFGKNMMRHNFDTINPVGHATDLFGEWAAAELDVLNEKKDPWFLYLAFNAPHDPIQPPEEWFEKVLERESSIDSTRAGIVALIEHLDYNIGKVLSHMKENSYLDNTLIFFCSDNGGALRFGANNGNLRGGKQDFYEGGIRVPAAVFWKGQLESGENDGFGMTMDIMPTICEITGIEHDLNMDGISLLSSWKEEEANTGDRFVYWMRREGWKYNGLCYYSARYEDLKLVQNTPYQPFEYFNILDDPGETSAIEATGSSPFKLLRNHLQKHIKEAGHIPWQGEYNTD